MKKLELIVALCLAAFAGHAQTTQITASNIAVFGGAAVTGQFCLTPTDGNGNALNLVTPGGQQFSPTVPLCFPIVAGVLSATAIVPDTSQTQPPNACYVLTVKNTANVTIGTYPCLQPQGSTWSFDAYVPSTLPSIPALTLPQYQVNGSPLSLQSVINFQCTGCTNPSAGTISILAGSTGLLPANNLSDVASAPAALANLNGADLGQNTYAGTQTAPAFWPQNITAGPYVSYLEEFFSAGSAAFSSIGTPTGQSCGVNTTYADVNHPGNILLVAGTGGSGTGITCGLQAQAADFVTPNNAAATWTWESAVLLPVLPGTTGETVQVGLTSSPAVSPWTTGIQFYMNGGTLNPNNWYCRYNSTNTNSAIAAVASAWTRLTMANDGTYLHWYVNGTEATACKTAIASMPSATQYPANWSITASSGTSVSMAVDYVSIQRTVTR